MILVRCTTVSGTPVGVDLLADLDTLLGDVTLRLPEDFQVMRPLPLKLQPQSRGLS